MEENKPYEPFNDRFLEFNRNFWLDAGRYFREHPPEKDTRLKLMMIAANLAAGIGNSFGHRE